MAPTQKRAVLADNDSDDNDSANPPPSKKPKKQQPSQVCSECGITVTNVAYHRQVCVIKTICCSYPSLEPGGLPDQVDVHRDAGDDFTKFKCVRCSSLIKKAQGMQDHAKKCTKVTPRVALPLNTAAVSQAEAPSLGPGNTSPLLPSLDDPASHPHGSEPPVQMGESIPSPSTAGSSALDQAPLLLLSFGQATADNSMPTNAMESTHALRSRVPNLLESLIIPGPDSLIDDPILKGTTFIVNTQHRVLICLECRCAVNPRTAAAHTRRHPGVSVPGNFNTCLAQKFPDLLNETIRPQVNGPIDAVFGLEISQDTYFICDLCKSGYSTRGSFRNHKCSKAIAGQHHDSYYQSVVQTFFRGPNLSYFPVHPPSFPSAQRKDDWTLYQEMTAETPTPSEDHNHVSYPENYLALDQVLRKEGWHSHVAGIPYRNIDVLTSQPLPVNLDPISSAVYAILSKAQATVQKSGHLARRLLGLRPSCDHDRQWIYQHHDIQPGAMKSYSETISCLVWFLLRCYRGSVSEYSMPLSELQSDACKRLSSCLSHHASTLSPNSDPEIDTQYVNPSVLDRQAFFCELDEDDDAEELKENEASSLNPFNSSVDPLTIVQADVLQLLRSLFSHRPPDDDDPFFSPLLRFIVLKSRQSDEQWLPVRQITKIFASILFCGRLTIMLMWLKELENGNAGTTKKILSAFEYFRAFLTDYRKGPIPLLYSFMRPLNVFAAEEDGSVTLTGLGSSRDSVLVLDRVIHLHDIRDLIQSLNKEIRLIMFEQLFFGLPFVRNDWTPGIIHDDPKKKSLTYSCFRDPHNIAFQQASIVVLQNILTHPQLRGRFHFVDTNGKIIWKPGPCLAYLQVCEQVEMMLFAASHTSVGPPARGTEFASHLLANFAGGHIRNVFVLFQSLILMGTYNKTSHITGGASNIARVPHLETGWLWMLYISHVRPVVIEWQRAFGTLAAASRAATHLFFGLHRPVTSTDLSRALTHHTQRLLGVRINIRLWRHVTTFFLNHHYNTVEWSRVGEDILQSPAKAQLAMQPSLAWHQILGFRSRSQSNTFQIREQDIQPLPISPSFPAIALPSSVATVHLLFMSKLRLALKAAHRRDLVAIHQVFNRDPSNFPLLSSPSTPSHRPFRSHLSDLKLFLRNDHAVFKDFQQACVVNLLSDSSLSLLIISPTGSGKTLPVFLNSAMYDNGATTVIVLPLIAMHEEYVSRTRQHGLRCEIWHSGSDPATAPQILLVAVENCTYFKAYLSCLTHLGRLARIMFDEAHLMLKHASFRPCFSALKFFGSIPAPIILMTATCTKEMERQLFAMMGRAVFRTLRRPSDRAEIAHSVTEVPTSTSSNFEEAVSSQITTAVKGIQGDGRSLLFCPSRDECDRMAELLGWLPYHSSITVQDRSINLRAWREGRIQGLSCTSMLNCCLDYPAVRFVFHLGQPRDVVDYWQAVGRSSRDGNPSHSIIFVPPLDRVKQFKAGVDDVFGTLAIAKMIYDQVCRRLHPVTFLDGHAVTCSMLPLAQMCDVCFQQYQQLTSGTLPQFDASYHSPHHGLSTSLIKPTSPPVNPLHTLSVLPTHPLRQPAPQASFANRLLAAWKVLESRHEHCSSASAMIGLLVLKACRSLCTICVACWFHGALQHSQSHRLQDCEGHGSFYRTSAWALWKKELRLPIGCCYFCGCPQKMTYVNECGDTVKVHAHESDLGCHWDTVLKPLAFVVIGQHGFMECLASRFFGGKMLSIADYSQWLVQTDKDGLLNLLHVLHQACESREVPSYHPTPYS